MSREVMGDPIDPMKRSAKNPTTRWTLTPMALTLMALGLAILLAPRSAAPQDSQSPHSQSAHDHDHQPAQSSPSPRHAYDPHDFLNPADQPAYDRLASTPKPKEQRQAQAISGIRQVLGMAMAALKDHEYQQAEGLHRAALMECWMLLGSVELADGKLHAARNALGEAARTMAQSHRITRISLALIQLWVDEAEAAVEILQAEADPRGRNLQVRLYYIHALVIAGHLDTAHLDTAREELAQLRQIVPEEVENIESALARTAADPTARWRAFRPRLNVGVLAQNTPAERDALRRTIIATQAQIAHNLAVLHSWAERPQRAAQYRKWAEETDPREQARGFPMIDLRSESLPRDVAPLSISSGILWKTATVELLEPIRKAEAGEIDAAIAQLSALLSDEAIVSANRTTAAIHDMLGILLAEQGKDDRAIEHFQAAIALKPDFLVHVREHLARLYFMRGREADGIRELRSAAEQGDLERDLTMKLAQVELDASLRDPAIEPQVARALLLSAVQRFKSLRALIELAKLDERTQGPEAGLRHLQQARGFSPSSEEVLAMLSRMLLKAGLPDQAIEPLKSLVRMHPQAAEYASLLNEVSLKIDDPGGSDPS